MLFLIIYLALFKVLVVSDLICKDCRTEVCKKYEEMKEVKRTAIKALKSFAEYCR